MKRISIVTFLLLCALGIHAQAPFAVFTPYPNTGSYQQSQPQDNFQTIWAYFINQRGAFEKIRIKVNVVRPQYGAEEVYVRAYCETTHNIWLTMNSRATEITQYSHDPAVIKENFSWKCYVQNVGNVYF